MDKIVESWFFVARGFALLANMYFLKTVVVQVTNGRIPLPLMVNLKARAVPMPNLSTERFFAFTKANDSQDYLLPSSFKIRAERGTFTDVCIPTSKPSFLISTEL